MFGKYVGNTRSRAQLATLGCCVAFSLGGSTSFKATPTTDDCTQGHGCFSTSSGSSGGFTLLAQFDIETHGSAGSFTYADSDGSLQVTSNQLIDYSYIDPYTRGFIFAVQNNPNFDSVRIIVSDYGAEPVNDLFEIQLLKNGNVVYQEGDALEAQCGGGIEIGEVCGQSPEGEGGGGGGGGGNPPPDSCDSDFVTGGGWIVGTPSGEKANFGVQGGFRNGALWGGLNYIDHDTGMHVQSRTVTSYTQISDVGRHINYNVTIDGEPGTATVKVYDNGEPGRDDVFSIQLSNGYSASGDLGGPRPGGGNLQLHKSHCPKVRETRQPKAKSKASVQN